MKRRAIANRVANLSRSRASLESSSRWTTAAHPRQTNMMTARELISERIGKRGFACQSNRLPGLPLRL
jgi:hypothetical protein